MQAFLFILLFSICLVDVLAQSDRSKFESIRNKSEFSHVKPALKFLVQEEKAAKRTRNNFYIVAEVGTGDALVYWKERNTVYLWIPGLLGSKTEREIAYGKRHWDGSRDVCPPAKCAFGSTYMMQRPDFIKMVRSCVKYGDHFSIP